MEIKLLYAILFLKGRNGSDVKELASLLKIKKDDVMKIVEKLQKKLYKEDSPLEIKVTETKIRLSLNKEISIELSKKMDKTINITLSKSTLETLTIVAYKQPTTKSEIESVRGVSADYAITKLLEYELIESNERSPLPGNPRLFVTTQKFLELFELNSLSELPEVSKQFEEKTAETTLFIYDEDEEKK